jgi:hypothetical protein
MLDKNVQQGEGIVVEDAETLQTGDPGFLVIRSASGFLNLL